jgi:hypothetical protein
MTSYWPEEFKPIPTTPPKKILDEQSAFLSNMTDGKVRSTTIKKDAIEAALSKHLNDFSYSFQVSGATLKNYSFKVFDFSHSITLYPVKITLDEEVQAELGRDKVIVAEDEADFISIIKLIFNSVRLRKIIGAIIQLSDK